MLFGATLMSLLTRKETMMSLSGCTALAFDAYSCKTHSLVATACHERFFMGGILLLRRRATLLLYVAAMLAVWPFPGRSVEAQAPSRRTPMLVEQRSTDRWLDWGIAAGAIGGTLLIPEPADCRWCDRDRAGRDALNGFDRAARDALRWTHTGSADTLSWITEFAPAGLIVGLNRGRLSETVSPVLRAFSVTYAVTGLAKVAAARERPLVHFGADPYTQANVSFFSGHSSGAFSLVFALARVNHDRHDPATKWVWAAGVPLATATGYLRIAADKHYATDVLVGAAAGAALGWSVPAWWGGRQGSRARVIPMLGPALGPGGRNVSLIWQW